MRNATKFRWLMVWTLLAGAARGAEEWLDRAGDALTFSTDEGAARARLSGTVDLEGYHFQAPAPGLIYAGGTDFFNPRLSLFLDAQAGQQIYFFAQARVDRGFDPGDDGSRRRLDEYALRFTPWADGRLTVQVGKFATVVGTWAQRHGSWANAFVSAPLLYESETAIWDVTAARSPTTLLRWAGIRPVATAAQRFAEKKSRSPIVWGPSYASGVAVSGLLGKAEYAVELKNAGLSSHPASWDAADRPWQQPTVSGRIGYRPNEMWRVGFSASTGSYLRASAASTLAAGYGLGDYRQTVLAQDVSFAWHHWQLWTEAYEARFEVPLVGDADLVAYYVEAKYKFTPQWSGAVRWNQQVFGSIPDGRGGITKWGRDAWRIDVAPTYRFTAHVQGKIEYGVKHEAGGLREWAQAWAAQMTVRF